MKIEINQACLLFTDIQGAVSLQASSFIREIRSLTDAQVVDSVYIGKDKIVVSAGIYQGSRTIVGKGQKFALNFIKSAIRQSIKQSAQMIADNNH